MRIELTYSAWKADILTIELISHFKTGPNSTPGELPRGLLPSIEGSRVLVWP